MYIYYKLSNFVILFSVNNVGNCRESCLLKQHSKKERNFGKLGTFLLGSIIVLFYISSK